MTTTGKWHLAKTYRYKRYTTKACRTCRVKPECSKAKYGKAIQRSEFQEYIVSNKERIEQNKTLYKQRQAIVEHPYGTIKRQWGFNYITTKKGKQRASADVGFMFIAYNLRRIMNIVGKHALRKYLEVLVLSILEKYRPIRFKLNPIKAINFLNKILSTFFETCLNRLKFDQNLLITEGF